MKKFWSSKKFWLASLALILMGLFIYLLFFSEKIEFPSSPGEIPEEIKNDKIPPSTVIRSPEDKSWWNHSFQVLIDDSDLGSGLVDFLSHLKGCRYIIEDLGTGQASGGFRECDSAEINVPVGQDKVCSSSYEKNDISQGKCKVSTKAYDKAGNESGWKSRVFNVDLIRPEVKEISLNRSLEPGADYLFETTVSDNSKVTGCWFFVDGINTWEKVKITPVPCENDENCTLSLNYNLKEEGDYLVRFACSDIAGNVGFGKAIKAKVTTNHPPEITSCKVNPNKGTVSTGFQFISEATDPEGNQISYLWDFGDGKTSNEKDPKHYYSLPGTYEPELIVSDSQGEKSQCQTSWVIVAEH